MTESHDETTPQEPADQAAPAGEPAEAPEVDEAVEADAGPSVEDQPFDSPQGSDAGRDELAAAQEALAERTADLQRLQAEYLNYKRRVERDRETFRKNGEAAVLGELLTTLDDLGRAEEHGELTGGFKAIADQVRAVASKFGLEAFGAQGEPFDPQLHEAVFHAGESADVEVTSIGQVMRVGYRVGDRVLRAATVGVVDPAAEPAAAEQPADEPANDTE